MGNHQDRGRMSQGVIQRGVYPAHELRQALTVFGRAGPIQIQRRGADQRAKITLAQPRIGNRLDVTFGGDGMGGFPGAAGIVANDAANRRGLREDTAPRITFLLGRVIPKRHARA